MVKGALREGDLLGIIATSGAVQADRFKAGVKYLEQLGFRTRIELDPTAAYGSKQYLFSSAPAPERAAALTRLFKDPEVKAVIAARGAYGALELQGLLDVGTLAKNAKPYIGFSDATALLVALEAANVPVIHGQNVESLWNANSEAEVAQGANALKGWLTTRESPFQGQKFEYLLKAKSAFKGSIVGGNLSILSALCGTPWQMKTKGKILFLEEVGEKPYRLHRMLLQLKQSGSLAGVQGVLLGDFKNCDIEQGPTKEEVFKDIFEPLAVPVLSGIPSGHQKLNLPVPFCSSVSVVDGVVSFIE